MAGPPPEVVRRAGREPAVPSVLRGHEHRTELGAPLPGSRAGPGRPATSGSTQRLRSWLPHARDGPAGRQIGVRTPGVLPAHTGRTIANGGREDMSHARMERIVLAAIAAFAVLLTIKYFPGFESETAYAGNAFQAIHPDAFAGDAYRGPERTWSQRPFQLSLIYLVIKFTGEIWLDDRFVAVVSWALCSPAFWASTASPSCWASPDGGTLDHPHVVPEGPPYPRKQCPAGPPPGRQSLRLRHPHHHLC